MLNKLKTIDKKIIISGIIGIIIVIVGIIVIINLFFAKEELSNKKIKEDVYIYFQQEKFDFKGNITLNHDENITNIRFNNRKTKLFSEPIYYANKKDIIIPVKYSVVSTSDGIQKLVNHYTELKNIDGEFYLTGNDLKYKLSNKHFLFDGSDYYIFLDNGTVTFGDQIIPFTPLSYANYIFDTKELYVYNYEEDKVYYFENVEGNIFAQTENYKANIYADTIIINGKDKLLMKNFDYLKKLK